MKTFRGLENHTKLVDVVQDDGKRLDGQVVEYIKDENGIEYLASLESMWNLNQFNPNDYEIYDGDKKIGEYV